MYMIEEYTMRHVYDRKVYLIYQYKKMQFFMKSDKNN